MSSTGGRAPEHLPPHHQVVRAVNGFAYGCVGADIHIFGDGVPLYVLRTWQPPDQPDPEWLRELPSRMLNARFAVVDFTGRDEELDSLRRWRAEDARLSVRWLHAPGGQGKSRLAAQLARESLDLGWTVATATHGPGSVLPPPGSQDLRTEPGAGVLLVVDYADRWPVTHLTWLFSNAMLHRPAGRARVLLLARGLDSWPAVRAALANLQASTSAQSLPPLDRGSTGPSARLRMFTAARDGFAARYGVPATAIGPPEELDQPGFGLTLAVHMAALAAVDAHAVGGRSPTDVEGLTIYLLDREHLHWENRYGDGTHDIDPGDRTYRTPPGVMNQTVFTAAVTGPTPRHTAIAVLDATLTSPPSARQVVADHAVCYPPAPAHQDIALEPLYPDRLAEDFLALTLPGHAAAYPAQSWASPTLTALMSRDGEDRHPTWTPRSVTVLAAAARRWPHLGPRHLDPLLRADPELALSAGSAALTTLADSADPTVLAAIAGRFPEHRDADLDPGIAAVTERLARHRLAQTDDAAERARLHQDLSARLANAGRWDDALAAIEQAMAEWERVSGTDPAAHRAGLARCLIDYGLALSRVGRFPEALAAENRAVSLHRQGAVAHDERLAEALNNLSSSLLFAGLSPAATDVAEESVRICRRLAKADPATHNAALAQSLNSLAIALGSIGRSRKGVAAAREAVEIYRGLVATNRAAYEDDLASALNNLAGLLDSRQRPDEAVAAAEEALPIRRRLARVNPGPHEWQLASLLHNLAIFLAKADRTAEAVTAARQAVEISRPLARANPVMHQNLLIGSLTDLADFLRRTGRLDEALTTVDEAVELAGLDTS